MNILHYFNYFCALFLILFGIFTGIAARNLYRKVIGISMLQSGVILFFITLAYKTGSVLPIVHPGAAQEHMAPEAFANPLPHALMLTAIVVGVATLGVALVLISSLYKTYQTTEEDEILEKMPPPDS